ncbi:MAG: histidine phosphatase family protein [Pseudomonadota bacterium]
MKRRQFILGTAAAALAPLVAQASSEVLAALAEPRTHAIMRHALAPGTGDPAGFTLGDCATQRTLDDRGREQARKTGERLRDAGVHFDRVLTSQWCRCEETARLLGLGPVEPAPPLNSFFRNRATGPGQTTELRRMLAEAPEAETLMLVTHQVNISALTGRATSSGEIVVFRLENDDAVTVLGKALLAPAW